MPMKMLNQLFDEVMPVQLTKLGDVHKLRILCAAGHVDATIPIAYYACDGKWHQDPATVHQVTPLGLKVLRYFGPAHSKPAFEKDRAA